MPVKSLSFLTHAGFLKVLAQLLLQHFPEPPGHFSPQEEKRIESIDRFIDPPIHDHLGSEALIACLNREQISAAFVHLRATN